MRLTMNLNAACMHYTLPADLSVAESPQPAASAVDLTGTAAGTSACYSLRKEELISVAYQSLSVTPAAHRRLGVPPDASFEEVQDARNFLYEV